VINNIKQEKKLESLSHLPSFAEYLLTHKLDEYVMEQLRLFKLYDVPLLRLLKNLSDEELFNLTKSGAKDLLSFLSQNNIKEYLKHSIERWLNNQLPNIDKHQVIAEDITLVSFIRKRALTGLAFEYANDTEQLLKLVEEIDILILELETSLSNVYMNLLKEKIEEHSNIIEKINSTTPGAIYVFDLEEHQNVYYNKHLQEVFGYSSEDLNILKKEAVSQLIHPEDYNLLKSQSQKIKEAKDGETITYKYRIKLKDGNYKWLQNTESVFKRNNNGEVKQLIGITLDIHKDEIIAKQLQQSQHELLNAQEIAQLGSFTWNFSNSHSHASEETKKILELQDENFETFMNKVHPEDQQKVRDAVKESLKTGTYECEYRLNANDKQKIIWSKGQVTFNNGIAETMNGTIMDVTERYQLIEQLKKNENLYKQAQAITHIGNYTWDLLTGNMEWSDELYRIYGLEPGKSKINFEFVQQIHHPEDVEIINEMVNDAIEKKQSFNFYYRIKLKDEIKILHARGNIVLDSEGNAITCIGTAQDVTEKQTLIRKLEQSDLLYKKVESLAKMGNWNWNLVTNKLDWTDELYRIYGLKPQQEEITIDKFLSFIHPADKAFVEAGLDDYKKKKFIDYTFRIITANGETKSLRSIAEVQYNDKGQAIAVVGTERDVTEKQELIGQLQQSERLFKQAQALAHLGNWSFEIDTKQYEWSDEMYKIYELERGNEVTYEEWQTFIHPDDKEDVLTYLDECIKYKKPYDKTHRIILRSGEIKVLHRKAEFISDDNGRVVKMLGTTQDITEQYLVQQELKENQNFIKKITDAAPSIITSYNINNGKYSYISGGIKKLLGYDPREALEKGIDFFMSIIHPDDLEALVIKNQKALEEANSLPSKTDIIVDFTYRMKGIDGNYHWFQTYGTVFDRNSEGKVEHILNISHDITEQMEAKDKIAEQEFFIQQVAEASPTILYIFDIGNNSIEYINREIFFVLGYTTDEVETMGSTVIKQLYHPDDYELLPERKESKKKFQHRNSMIQYECRVKGKDGEWKWLLVREVIFKSDEAGKPLQILGAALDISKRKDMEKSLLQNSFQLQQSNASLEEFAYVASHDLKEPLRKISTFGDRLVNTQIDNLSDDGKIYLKKIVDASQRMQTMINDLLSISMITGDRSFQQFSLQNILQDVIQTLEFKIEQKNAIITFDELPEAHIVPSQFRQLFQNLISNSLKFITEDVQPRIEIKHSFLQPDEVNINITKAAQYLKIDITDNGIGFEDEFAGKIFQIFQRLHGRSEYEGTGIGLAICKKIVEHHGGVIYANGILNKGATFTIILPA
jgi:PAS domain S-box-containing protein